jgi:hypothetical protein
VASKNRDEDTGYFTEQRFQRSSYRHAYPAKKESRLVQEPEALKRLASSKAATGVDGIYHDVIATCQNRMH